MHRGRVADLPHCASLICHLSREKQSLSVPSLLLSCQPCQCLSPSSCCKHSVLSNGGKRNRKKKERNTDNWRVTKRLDKTPGTKR